jgi:hypothetical protein
VKETADKSKGDNARFLKLADEISRKAAKKSNTLDIGTLNLEKSVERRNIEGGTSGAAVKAQMRKAAAALARNSQVAGAMKTRTEKTLSLLQ